MPQVIIHASSAIESEKKKQLVQKIRDAIPDLLQISEHIGQVIFYETSKNSRSSHKSRDQNFIFVEATMYPGRSQEMKETFVNHLIILISESTGVNPKDINCVIHQISPENYFGGVSHKYIEDLKTKNN